MQAKRLCMAAILFCAALCPWTQAKILFHSDFELGETYLAKPLKPVAIKQWVSLILLALQITLLIWRIKVPHILDSLRPESTLYFLLTLFLLPLVIVIGWHGAMLTFPIEK